MSETAVPIGILLIVGPILGLAPVANPALMRVWTAPRKTHLAIVGAHRRAWALLNVGFGLATVATAAGLAMLAATLGGDPRWTVALAAAAIAYAVGGALWCVVLAARAQTTPLLADLVAAGRPTEPAEALLGACLGGIYGGFVLVTAASLVVLGTTLILGGGVAAPVAVAVAAGGAAVLAWYLAAGDTIPAVLYLPTMLLGLALIAGWA
jgi:hypothetical protein